MWKLAAALALFLSAFNVQAQTLKSILLEQLRTTHDKKEWFVPINVAVEGLTPEQAKWTDGTGNHSVGQLAAHLLFWNQRELSRFRGEKPGAFNGKNDETFNSFDAKTWSETVSKLDQVMKDWEKAVQDADDAKIQKEASAIAHIGAHNAYHVGQMVFVRKLHGTWNPDKGVKD